MFKDVIQIIGTLFHTCHQMFFGSVQRFMWLRPFVTPIDWIDSILIALPLQIHGYLCWWKCSTRCRKYNTHHLSKSCMNEYVLHTLIPATVSVLVNNRLSLCWHTHARRRVALVTHRHKTHHHHGPLSNAIRADTIRMEMWCICSFIHSFLPLVFIGQRHGPSVAVTLINFPLGNESATYSSPG